MGKQVLVTGAGGFIGSHLVEGLVHAGWNVRAMVRYNSKGAAGWLDETRVVDLGAEIVFGDVQDPDFVRKSVRGCDVVMHLAALIGIPYSYVAPAQYVATNITGTLNVLQAARDCSVDMVIQTSTSEVYGSAQTVPMTEDHPLVGQSPYSATKIGADQLALSYHRAFGLPVAIIRPFNTYGPRQSTRAVIPTIITQLLSGAETVKIGSLTPTRDFNFVEDTVDAFIAMAGSPAAIGEVINVGSGFEVSVGDVLDIVGEVIGVKASATSDAQRLRPAASEVDRLLADASKAKRLMSWSPKFGGRDGFRRGIEQSVRWFEGRTTMPGVGQYAV